MGQSVQVYFAIFMLTKVKKFLTPAKIILLIEAATVFLAAFGLIPKEAVLFLSGLLLFYFLFAPTSQAVLIFIASVPLFVALPFSAGFDHMANWRLFALAIFLAWFCRRGFWRFSFWRAKLKQPLFTNFNVFEILGWLFFGSLLVSLLASVDLIAGLKKIAFLVNIFLLYPVVKDLLRRYKNFWQRLLRVLGVAVFWVLLVGLVQLVFVFFRPLFVFWQYWAGRFVDAFYGSGLAKLLSFSNTWFAYNDVQPPTLRLFSVFPDSHSFALFLILTLPALIVLGYFSAKKWIKRITLLLVGGAFLGIVLSGSRGAWLSFIVAAGVALLIFLLVTDRRPLALTNILVLVIFLGTFGLSLIYPSTLFWAQSYQTGEGDMTGSLAFLKRVKSISDTRELSNHGRLQIWESSVKSVAEHPLLGVGVGNFPVVLGEDFSVLKRGASAHNLFLDFGAESGVLSMVLLLFIFLEIFKMIWRVFLRTADKKIALLFISFFIYIAWALGYSLFDVVLLNDKVLLIFVVSLAIINFNFQKDEKSGANQ